MGGSSIMSKGAQWRAEVKAALAKQHRQQRQRRGKRHTLPCGTVTGPGMIRRAPRDDGPHDHPGEMPEQIMRREMEDGA
jgi:hypothetical protein